MAGIQELSNRQIDESIAAAVERRVPMSITFPSGKSWASVPGRALRVRDMHLLIELPAPGEGQEPHHFSPADKVGVSFKLKHHKHIFNALVAGTEPGGGGNGAASLILCLCRPTRMQRLQRRSYLRVDVPSNRIVRASFWLGGMSSEPSVVSPSTPVWSGRVTNLSAGGFQAHVDLEATGALEDGDIVGVRLAFGMADQAVYADAEVRHMEEGESKSVIGFRFVGMDLSPQGRSTLEMIAYKVHEYDRINSAVSAKLRSASAPFRAPVGNGSVTVVHEHQPASDD
ncbi:MAG: PilZ domain-containing protein [Phycisphaerae bacterium]|jgi:hypothetical protein